MSHTEVFSETSRYIAPPNPFENKDWRIPYDPLCRQGDIQTIAANYWPRCFNGQQYPTQSLYFDTEPSTRVLAKLNLQPGSELGQARPTVLAIHGLESCDLAPYMISAVQGALRAGFDVVRLNVRNCGGTEHLCQTLYHSGLTVDLRSVVEQLAPRPLHLLGFSMGGNIALKLAGEWGSQAPAHVRAVCGVSVPLRLDLCSRKIGLRRNLVYEVRFLRRLQNTMLRKAKALQLDDPRPILASTKNIWQFDDMVTAPAFGFRDAADYYQQSSAARFLDRIRVPSLLLQAQDDPFIPFEAFDVPAFETNPWVHLVAEQHGGHVAFLSRNRPRFWAIEQAMKFFQLFEGSERAENR